MVAGGDIIYAADINLAQLKRVGTTLGTSDGTATSGTTELAIDQVTATLVAGYRYNLRWFARWAFTVATDDFFLLLREDSGISGTQIAFMTVEADEKHAIITADFVAASSGSKTFTGTFRRSAGTGTLTANGSATGPRLFTVDFAATS